MNKYIAVSQLILARARAVSGVAKPTQMQLAQAETEVTCYLGGGERCLADINTIPQESPAWLIPGFGYAPVRPADGRMFT